MRFARHCRRIRVLHDIEEGSSFISRPFSNIDQLINIYRFEIVHMNINSMSRQVVNVFVWKNNVKSIVYESPHTKIHAQHHIVYTLRPKSIRILTFAKLLETIFFLRIE